ncbi:ferrous iron transport protein B [Erysipelotrichaceae bacterium RD49]|nr:ferrous iron transport protein B [Erysipelotrichaceae bacterium RD49]
MIKIALAGNPNSGKTTLFNALTGSKQYVGNWPGVTVEKKEGRLKGQNEIIIQDLPGIYSLSPYTPEEVVTRNYLIHEKPNAILNMVDASTLERNLYLTSQLLELNLPVVVALNMMDVVQKNNDQIDAAALSKRLGCPVIEMSAAGGQGIDEVSKAAVAAAVGRKKPNVSEFSRPVENVLHAIEEQLPKSEESRWYAIKVFEKDEKIIPELKLSPESLKTIDGLRDGLETEYDDDAESIITDQRYNWIAKTLAGVYEKNRSHTLTISDRIDKIVTNRFLALPIFVLVMGLVYYLSISTIGTMCTDWVNDVFVPEWCQANMTAFLESVHASDWVVSLVVDGIIGGLGAPLGFVPQMAVVFLCLSFLEDCGYMSRVAFIMDRIFRRFGLSGKSFISFMVSTGCGVPGIMAARTIEEERDRKMTMIVTTSMPCGAKLPVIALIAGAILGGVDAWWIAWATYLFGIFAIILSALILKHTKMFAGEPAPFIMELPAYHWPRLNNVLRQTWQRCWHFIKKAGTILFACCVVTWFLLAYGFTADGFGMVDEVSQSLMAVIGGWIAPLFAPLGWGNWQATAASMAGFVAKEQIVATMGVLVNVLDDTGEDPQLWLAVMQIFPSAIAAFSFLVFNMLDAPCLAAISTLAKEMNSRKWTWFAIGWQMFYAYTVALIVYQLGTWATGGGFGVGTVVALAVLVWYIYMIFKPVKKTAPSSVRMNAA